MPAALIQKCTNVSKRPNLYVLCGVSGSGKSTWATDFVSENKDIVRVSRDSYRDMLKGAGKHQGILSSKEESYITDLQNDAILYLLSNGKSVIVDDTNLRISNIENFKNKYADHIECLHILVFDNRDAILNNKKRMSCKIVPDDIIKKQTERLKSLIGELDKDNSLIKINAHKINQQTEYWASNQYLCSQYTWMNPNCLCSLATIYNERFCGNKEKKMGIICDLDGTLAWMCDRSHYDFYLALKDTANPFLTCILKLLPSDIMVFFVSGRTPRDGDENGGRAVSELWIESLNLPCDWQLLMRQDGDFRSDDIVKKEIFDKLRTDNPDINWMCFDDRHDVVDMWRQNGVYVFDCNQQRSRF